MQTSILEDSQTSTLPEESLLVGSGMACVEKTGSNIEIIIIIFIIISIQNWVHWVTPNLILLYNLIQHIQGALGYT